MVSRWTRRTVLGAAVALPVAALAARLWRDPEVGRDGAVVLNWDDLLPETDRARAVSGVVEHGQISNLFAQPPSTGLRTDWNEQLVRIPGYVVPIAYEGQLVREFILVPYVGACIHVPPPPANQLVYVTTERPFEIGGVFDPVSVTGMLSANLISTEVADIGYRMSAMVVRRHDA